MKKNALFILIIISVFLGNGYAHSDDVTARAYLDTNAGLIGDQLNLRLEVKTKNEFPVTWPAIYDTIGHLEVVFRSVIDTLDTNGRRILSQKFALTTFDTGTFEIPSFTFMYEKKGISTLFPVTIAPMYVKFATVAVDTALPIKDIKGLMDVPASWDEYLIYLYILLGLIVIGIAVWYYLKKRKPQLIEKLDYSPKIPAHIMALEALSHLEDEKLWQKGFTKKYYIQLTEIVRTYIERRFDIDSLEMTSSETIEALENHGIKGEFIVKFRAMLELADLVKFAKADPLPDDHSSSMKAAIEFVKSTIPVKKAEDENSREGGAA